MKILITGGTGRVGANLASALLDKGHDIRSFVYPGDQSRAHKLDGFERVETLEGDLRDFAAVRRAVDGVDAVYHIAAAFGGPFNHREYLAINGMGTINLLEAIRELTPSLHRLVYASTEAIYWSNPYNGRCFEEPIREDQVARYQTMPYFLTKWIGEELVMSYHLQFGLPSVTTRFATIIEPGEFLDESGLPPLFLLGPTYERCKDQDGAFAEQIRALWTGEEQFLLARNPDGRPYKQQFADVRDIVQGLVLTLERDEAVGEVFNLGGAALFDWGEVVPYLAERFGLKFVEARRPDWNFFELDLTNIKEKLGFAPEHDLASVLDAAEAMRRGEDVGIIPTGVRFGRA